MNPSDSVAPHYAVAVAAHRDVAVAVGIPSWHSLSAILASAAILCAANCRRRRRIHDMPGFDSVKRELGFVLRFMLRFSSDPSTMMWMRHSPYCKLISFHRCCGIWKQLLFCVSSSRNKRQNDEGLDACRGGTLGVSHL
ncbi:hypothetical protein PIB30_069223 [Stylosanthes scabra]|uniref:Uncharacterized protein n=1 Tax=Stylosanthes scabra TaxID=79078 RepID=A0ABU6XLB6_9FABA|nr:hypothetical protein [Stylosanthes scabra]